MQNRCPRCNSKLPIKRFLFPVVTNGYNNIDEDLFICGKCSAYFDWTKNRKIAVLLSYVFCIIYLFIGGSLISNNWFLKVLLPGIIIPLMILLFFPRQISVRKEIDYSKNMDM